MVRIGFGGIQNCKYSINAILFHIGKLHKSAQILVSLPSPLCSPRLFANEPCHGLCWTDIQVCNASEFPFLVTKADHWHAYVWASVPQDEFEIARFCNGSLLYQ